MVRRNVTPETKATDRKADLLDAAIEQIATQGVRGLRVEDVAQRAGVSTALIYHHFGDRATFLRLALEHIGDRAEAYTARTPGGSEVDGLIASLLDEIQDVPLVNKNSTAWAELRNAAIFDPRLRPTFAAQTERWSRDIAASIGRAKAQGELPATHDEEALAIQLSAMVEGISGRWLSGQLSARQAREHLKAASSALLRLALSATLVVFAACSARPEGSEGRQVETPSIESAAPRAPRSAVRSPEGTVTLLINGAFYTANPRQPWAQAMAYDADGEIVAIGELARVRAAAGPNAHQIDLEGKMVVPGFVDGHVHVPEAGINQGLCELPPGKSLPIYERLMAKCATEQKGERWVRAAGASLFGLRRAGELPIIALDRAVPDRPAMVLDDLGHALWTNSRGLTAAGIRPNDPDPPGGVFHRDPRTGRPTGLLLENAQHRVRDVARPGDEVIDEGLALALEELAANGLTTVSDAGGFWRQRHPEAWRRAEVAGELTVRAVNALYLYPDLAPDAQIAEFKRRFSNDSERLLRFNTAKIYVDGILDLGTAALLEPYDRPVDVKYPKGFFYFEQARLNRYARDLYKLGYQLHFHVIGDAATRAALDAVESIGKAGFRDVAERRHRTTHTYLVHPDDVFRFAALGVTADFQAGPESTDVEYHDDLAGSIGDRANGLLPTAKLLAAGAAVP